MREISLPLDASGYVRRECPNCRRHFKTRPLAEDGNVVQNLLTEQLAHHNPDEAMETEATLVCLYCGKPERIDQMLTGEQKKYFERLAKSFAEHVRYEQLSYVARTLKHNPQPTFVPVHPGQMPGDIRPDPDDMKVVPLVCCGEEAKAAQGWEDPYYCPKCGFEQATGVRRKKVQLSFQRE